MTPNSKGWLQQYLNFRKEILKDITLDSNKGSHPEFSLYRIIQPTGIMYGHSVGLPLPNIDQWSNKEKMKVLLAECLIGSAMVFNNKPVQGTEDFETITYEAIKNIGAFYNSIFPESSVPAKSLFGKKKDPVELAEKILNKRVALTGQYEKNFWSYFFHNSLLFLDVFIFSQWIHTHGDKIVSDFFRYEREELRFSVIKIIAAASHANQELAYEEKKLFELFLQSTDLNAEKRKEALQVFETGLDVYELNLPSENSWILKRFFLEIAILTLWVDKKLEESEKNFLHQLCRYLNFTDEDLESSCIAIEGFVLEHWGELDHLQNKQDYLEVSNLFIQKITSIAENNKGILIKATQSEHKLALLMEKGKAGELNPDERELLRTILIEALKAIPAFAFISLPQDFLTLNILFQILPKELFRQT